MKMACVTVHDATNPGAFGGRLYYMTSALRARCDSFEHIGPLSKTRYKLLLAAKWRAYKWLFRKNYYSDRDRLLIRHYAKQISKKLRNSDADVLFSPMSPGSQPVAYLDCHQPIIIWTDATFAGTLDFYPELKRDRLCKETLKDGIANERAALNRCTLAIYSSDWAARTAIENYQLDPAKVKVVPFGANLESTLDFDQVSGIVRSRSRDTCRLLFLAAEWHRKGGDTALQVAQQLRKNGLETELWVVGCRPAATEPLPRFVKTWDYISRSTEEGAEKLDRLVQECHFLILPTKADCTPTVVSEANSFGLPCITTDIGGLPTQVRDNINGKKFSEATCVQEYCDYIYAVFSDSGKYSELALSSFEEYRSRLNWSVAATKVKSLIEAVL